MRGRSWSIRDGFPPAISSTSQAHLLAISGRRQLEDALTDVLLSRGNEEVVFKLATNSGARFSKTGYGILVKDAAGDDRLAETVGLRFDIPPPFLRKLLQRATEAVRSRILALAPPETREEIQRVIAQTAKSVGETAVAQRDFTAAESLVLALEKSGKLDEGALLAFVDQHRYEEMTVALARLCSASLKMVSGLMAGLRNDALLIPCKAADLQWATAKAILRNRHANHKIADQLIELARSDYDRLSVATARRTLRFMQSSRRCQIAHRRHPEPVNPVSAHSRARGNPVPSQNALDQRQPQRCWRARAPHSSSRQRKLSAFLREHWVPAFAGTSGRG